MVHDIYGLDQSSESGRECVICMTDPRDTIVLPCRHMCLCRGCAEVLRYQTNKCPICRSCRFPFSFMPSIMISYIFQLLVFTALLKIEVSNGEEAAKEGAEEEEGTLVSKKKKRNVGEKEEQKLTERKKKKKDAEKGKEEVKPTTGELPADEALHGSRDISISVAN